VEEGRRSGSSYFLVAELLFPPQQCFVTAA
jgi:hypothetical protein